MRCNTELDVFLMDAKLGTMYLGKLTHGYTYVPTAQPFNERINIYYVLQYCKFRKIFPQYRPVTIA